MKKPAKKQKQNRVHKIIGFEPEEPMTVISNCVIRVAEPHGTYYDQIHKPAVDKAGLRPVQADAEIFGAGRLTEQESNGDLTPFLTPFSI